MPNFQVYIQSGYLWLDRSQLPRRNDSNINQIQQKHVTTRTTARADLKIGLTNVREAKSTISCINSLPCAFEFSLDVVLSLKNLHFNSSHEHCYTRWFIPIQRGCSPLHVPSAWHVRVADPTSLNPELHA